MDDNSKRPILGILGGLGPMASVYFYEMLVAHTAVTCDQEHIDLLISSRASTPDRTAFILGQSHNDPLPIMIEEAKRLSQAGATMLVLPCNTAHYFYDALAKACPIPLLHIVEETVAHCARRGMKRIGILATEGTVRSETYRRVCRNYGIEDIVPSEASQAIINTIIYDEIKCGKAPSMTAFASVAEELRGKGCETLVLGCTELSLLKRDGLPDSGYTDSLEVLADAAIRACGKTPIGFHL